jgi:hypothetical protein
MALLGSGKRILMVGGEGVTLYGPTARGVERETAISWEVPNFDQQLTEALTEQNQGSSILVLFDGADQTYRKEENIPKLVLFDRIRYIKRKLDMAFPSYPVRASIQIKPPNEPPYYLFAALPETERLDRIADDMLEAGVPIAGFGLLPAESVGLVTTLAGKVFQKEGKPSGWAVLVAQHETGGLRQVVVKNGNLALTRLTPTSEAGVQGPAWADEVMREFKATLTYISRFGYTPEEGLDVIVICGNIEKQFFNDKSLPVTNFQCLTTAEALTTIGARGISLGEVNFGDPLHAAWTARKRALAAPVEVPSIQHIMMPRRYARFVTVFFLLSLLGLCYFVFSGYADYNALQNDIVGRQTQKAVLQQDYDEESKIFDAYPVKPDTVKAALAVRELVGNSGVNIAPFLRTLHAALDPDMKLSHLELAHDATAVLKPSHAPGAQRSPYAPPERGILKISFGFNITSPIPLEQKVARAEKLLETLKVAFTGYNVRIISQFGNVSRMGKFEGETGAVATADPKDEAAEFEIEGAPQ